MLAFYIAMCLYNNVLEETPVQTCGPPPARALLLAMGPKAAQDWHS